MCAWDIATVAAEFPGWRIGVHYTAFGERYYLAHPGRKAPWYTYAHLVAGLRGTVLAPDLRRLRMRIAEQNRLRAEHAIHGETPSDRWQ